MPPAGFVGTWFSATAKSPTLHRKRRCEGLERSPFPQRLWFEDFDSYAFSSPHRPCRMCALEEVLCRTLSVHEGPEIFVTFTSQARPVDLRRYRFDKASASGQARLRRVADKVGLETAATEIGPVAYGFVPQRALSVLTRNLRTIVREDILALPAPDVVEVLWGLLQMDPPELRVAAARAGSDQRDPYELARLLVGAPAS